MGKGNGNGDDDKNSIQKGVEAEIKRTNDPKDDGLHNTQ